jgi:cyclohexane-1-carboxylate hydroxylase
MTQASYSHELNWPAELGPYDAMSFAIQANPFPWFAWMREHAPVLKVRTPTADLWFVSRYEQVTRALRSPKQFSSSTVDPVGLPLLTLMDPPRHARVREAAARAFTPKAVARFENQIRELTARLLQPLIEEGGGSLIDRFAMPLTIGTIGSLLGVPTSRIDQLKRWSDDLNNYVGRIARNAPGSANDEQGYREFLAFMLSLLEAARPDDAESVIGNLSRLWKSGGLSEHEATLFGAFLFSAGHETTTILIANGFRTLAEQPELLDRMRQNEGDITRFVEESARFRAAVQRLPRITTQDVDVGGYVIPKGASVRMLPGSANRDSAKFPGGERFDIDRDTTGHLGFGHGIHMCVGQWLARLEARITFEILARTVRRVEIDAREPILFYEGGTMSNAGPRAMKVLFGT